MYTYAHIHMLKSSHIGAGMVGHWIELFYACSRPELDPQQPIPLNSITQE